MKTARLLSTICTGALGAGLAVSAAMAQAMPLGCFARDYSAAHLAAHPDQGVAQLRVEFLPPDAGGDAQAGFTLRAVMADQGQALRDGVSGQVLGEVGHCDGPGACLVYCDGGGFEIADVTNDEVVISTTHTRLTNDLCGGGTATSSLAERPGEVSQYVLSAAPFSACMEF